MINAFTLVVSTLLLTTSSAASIPLQDAGAPHDVDAHFFASRALPTTNSTANSTSNSTSVCSVDQTLPPTNLTLCGNATLFNVSSRGETELRASLIFPSTPRSGAAKPESPHPKAGRMIRWQCGRGPRKMVGAFTPDGKRTPVT